MNNDDVTSVVNVVGIVVVIKSVIKTTVTTNGLAHVAMMEILRGKMEVDGGAGSTGCSRRSPSSFKEVADEGITDRKRCSTEHTHPDEVRQYVTQLCLHCVTLALRLAVLIICEKALTNFMKTSVYSFKRIHQNSALFLSSNCMVPHLNTTIVSI